MLHKLLPLKIANPKTPQHRMHLSAVVFFTARSKIFLAAQALKPTFFRVSGNFVVHVAFFPASREHSSGKPAP